MLTLPKIFLLLATYRYFLLYPVVVIEGPIVTVIAGFLASLGFLDVFWVYVVVVLGDLTGDSLYYALGRWGRKRIVEKYGWHVGITPRLIEKFEGYLHKHTAKTLFFGKFSQALCVPILIAAGVAKVPYRKYITINLFATLIKSLILLLIGFYFGQAYAKIARYLDITAIIVLILAVIFLLFYLYMQKLAPKLSKNGR